MYTVHILRHVMLPWVRRQQHVHAEASPCSSVTEGLRSVDSSLAASLSWHQRQLWHAPLLLLGGVLMPIIVRPLLITANIDKNCCVLLITMKVILFCLLCLLTHLLAAVGQTVSLPRIGLGLSLVCEVSKDCHMELSVFYYYIF